MTKAAEDREKKLFGMIGLAQRAGKLRTGEFMTEKSVKSGRSKLCLIASDASEATRKRFMDMCRLRKVPVLICDFDKETLGHTAGKELRSSASVEDAGFAGKISQLIEGGNVNE